MKSLTFLKRQVKRLPGSFKYYADGSVAPDDQKEPFKGKSYFRFVANNIVFNVHEDDDLIAKWETGEVREIYVTENEAGQYSYDTFATRKDLLDDASFDAELDYVRNQFKPEYRALNVADIEKTAGL